jgi:hypothetical protein
MIYYGVTSPYPIPTHPVEGDDLGRGSQNCDVLGNYTKRHRDIDWIGIGVVATG